MKRSIWEEPPSCADIALMVVTLIAILCVAVAMALVVRWALS